MKSVPVRRVTWPSQLSKNYINNLPVAAFLWPVKANVYKAMFQDKWHLPVWPPFRSICCILTIDWFSLLACREMDFHAVWCDVMQRDVEQRSVLCQRLSLVSLEFPDMLLPRWRLQKLNYCLQINRYSNVSFSFVTKLFSNFLTWSLVGASKIMYIIASISL